MTIGMLLLICLICYLVGKDRGLVEGYKEGIRDANEMHGYYKDDVEETEDDEDEVE